ncbi:MAG: S8 family serine peptidase [Bacteroidales bacterium]
MKKLFTWLFVAIFFISAIGSNCYAAGTHVITDHLAQELINMNQDEYIRINITLAEQFDSQSLIAQAKSKDKAQRREYVISVLKDFAELSQEGIIAQLNLLQKEASVKKVTTFWIANVINCYATPSAIEELSYRADISSIDYDEYRQMIDPAEYKNAFYIEGNPGSKEITWNVIKINADDVWALGFTGEGVIVAVLDTGVNYNHLDLADHMWESTEYPNHGYDFVNNDMNPMDDHGHGTHCAGTVAGDGTAGSQTGMAPDATIMACKVMDSGGGGAESGVWEAIEFSVEEGAQVLSLSLGWQHDWGPNRMVWRQTFDAVLAAGVIAAVAAGNEGDQQGTYPIPDNVRTPGDCPPPWLNPDQTLVGGNSSVVCVGSTTISDAVSSFSSRGPVTWSAINTYNDYPYSPEIGLIRPDLAAPGSNIKSLSFSSNTGYADGWSGTSMATPAYAGMIALMLQKNNVLTPEQISQISEETTEVLVPGKNNNSGSGRIDALAAIEATSLPGPSYYAHVINDAAGNNDGLINAGESVLLTLSVANFSEDIVNGVTVDLSTESEHITITDNSEYFGDFALEDIIEVTDAFAFDVAENIPGGEDIKFIVTAHNSEGSWESSFVEMAVAINLQTGSLIISDPTGNNNGSLDPGETADVFIEVMNTGQIDATSTMASLSTIAPEITINSGSFDIGTVAAGDTEMAAFNITVDAAAGTGISVELLFGALSGFYTLENSFFPKIGLIVEDFETGDFTKFDWEFSGNQDWTIVTSDVYEGVYSAKSGSIGSNQNSEMKLTMEVAGNDSIAFYRKVSSEATYDFLEFYIDNTIVAQWSGNVDWSRVAFAVPAGEHTFRWRYFKDGSVSTGSDCGWVDFIELPAFADEAMSVMAGNDEAICEGEDFQTNAVAQNYNTLLWETSGTGTFDDDEELDAIYSPSNDDYIAGSVMLTLTVYGDEGAELSDEMELSFMVMPSLAGTVTGPVEACAGYSDDYQISEIVFADSYNWVLTPEDAGEISGDGMEMTITWDVDFTGVAALKVQGVNDCGEGEFSAELDIVVSICTGIPELSNRSYSVLPNPNNGNFTISFKDNSKTVSSVKLMDITGKVVFETGENISEQVNVRLDNISEGMYFLLVETGDSRSVEKIIISK